MCFNFCPLDTVREMEEVSCSEEESEVVEPPPKKIAPAAAASAASNGKSAAPSSKKKISPPVGKKQGSLLSFFAKKWKLPFDWLLFVTSIVFNKNLEIKRLSSQYSHKINGLFTFLIQCMTSRGRIRITERHIILLTFITFTATFDSYKFLHICSFFY